jgi:predicted nuclease of predicted toxin-antitoxin system
MRFLADQNVYASTLRLLASLGHDVVTAADAGLARAEDATLLDHARSQSRLLVTRDRDFGHLVVGSSGGGVLYLRMQPATVAAVNQELARVLGRYSESELAASFVVIEPGRHRRRLIAG